MLTKILAAVVAAVAIGTTGVYFATSTDARPAGGGCPLCVMAESASCPLSEGTCDSAAADATACSAEGKCGATACGSKSAATAQVKTKTLVAAAAVGCCAIGAECCDAGTGCCEK